MFHIASILISLAALLHWLNTKYLKLPTTIGVMLISLFASLILVLFTEAETGLRGQLAHLLSQINFHALVFHGMLPFLLFAGALHINFQDLKAEWQTVTLLALAGTAGSIFAVAAGLHLLLLCLGLPIPWIGCLLFGALISPTDPIAVLGIMKSAGAPKSIETQIAGESLFNDGVGVVAFTALLAVAAGDKFPSPLGTTVLLFREIGGALLIGAITGYVGLLFVKSIDRYQVEILLTLGVATGSYALAETLHASAPIAVVVAGLCIGNQGRAFSMSTPTAKRLDEFWELIDDFLNVCLFMLMGVAVIILPFHSASLAEGAAAIAVSLLARLLIVACIVAALARLKRPLPVGSIPILTWAGLRGGVSLALALLLPSGEHRDTLLTAAYVVVIFSVLVQGLTIAPLIRWFSPRESQSPNSSQSDSSGSDNTFADDSAAHP